MFDAAIPGFEPSTEALIVAARSFDVLVSAIAHDQQHGSLSGGEPTTLAWILWGIVHGFVMLEISGMAPPTAVVSAEKAFADAVAAVLRGLAP